MKAFSTLALLALLPFSPARGEPLDAARGEQEPPKPPQGRDELIKQDIEAAVKKLDSEKYTEGFVAREELVELGRRAVPAVVAELVKLEANKGDQTLARKKRALCEILGGIRDAHKDAVAALVARLKDLDEFGTSIASAAARALAAIGDDGAAPALLETLNSKGIDTDRMLKYECIRALGLLRSKEAVEALRKALEDKKTAQVGEGDTEAHTIAAAAADALGLLRSQEAVDDLGKMLAETTTDPSSGLVLGVFAARALQRILAHEIAAKKDDPRGAPISGEGAEATKALDPWKKWWEEKTAKGKIADTRTRLEKIAAAIEAYKKDQEKYPDVLENLKKAPTDPRKPYPKDGYYAGDLKDAWERPFGYRAPGTGAEYDLLSYGLDGRAWGGGDNADLWNHERWKAVKAEENKKKVEEGVKLIAQFKMDQDRYPDKLLDLVVRPAFALTKPWPEKGYSLGVPKDAFDFYLTFRIPGTEGEPFDLVSLGADNLEGGTGPDEDVWNHAKRPPKKEEPKKN